MSLKMHLLQCRDRRENILHIMVYKKILFYPKVAVEAGSKGL